MKSLFYFVAFLSFVDISVFADECTQACDVARPTGENITFCGIDGLTYSSTFEAVNKDSCYLVCGVATLYEGVCGCPNECQSAVGQGNCSEGKCVCESGWGGADCSLPITANPCGYHGKLIEPSDSSAMFSFPYCDCDSGWTGTDCTTQMPNIGNAPWGSVFSDPPQYTSKDTYGDDHPIFNVESLPTIRLTMKEEDFIYLVTPANLYNGSYVPADVYWYDSKNSFAFKQVGLKLKGQGSRESQKKGFSIKFNEYISGQKFYDVKKIGLKGGSETGALFAKNMIYHNLLRAVNGGPTARQSYALLYINDRFYGLMIITEDIDVDFLDRRLANDRGEGNLLKLYYSTHLAFYGNDSSYYLNKIHVTDTGGVEYFYNVENDFEGNVWEDFTDFLYFFNYTTNDNPRRDFDTTAEKYLDIPLLLRLFVVESLVLAPDNFLSGNNYFTYHRQDGSSQWLIFYYDFDNLLYFDPPSSNIPEENSDILQIFNVNDQNDYKHYNPILDQIFNTSIAANYSSKYISQYLNDFSIYMEAVFGSDSPQQPITRFNKLFNMVSSWVQRDRMYLMSNNMNYEDFVLDGEQTMSHLEWRTQNVHEQLNNRYSQFLSRKNT
jgi:hypothetical protein